MYMVYDLCVHVKFGDSGFQTYNSNMLSKYSILELWGTWSSKAIISTVYLRM